MKQEIKQQMKKSWVKPELSDLNLEMTQDKGGNGNSNAGGNGSGYTYGFQQPNNPN